MSATLAAFRVRARWTASPLVAGYAWGLAAALMWGAYLAFARVGVVGGLAPVDFVLLRFGTAGLLLAPWLLLRTSRGPALAGIGWRRGLALAALAGPAFILLGTLGYRYAPLAHGAVVQPAAVTIGTLALAALLLGERVAWPRWAGVMVIVAGLALVSGAGMATGGAWKGDAAFAAAGVLWAGFTVASRAWKVDPLAGTAVVAVLGAGVSLPLWLAFGDPAALLAQGWRVLGVQVLVQGVLSGVLAVLAYSRAAEALGPTRAALFPALVPGLAVLAGIPVAGEWPSVVQWLGLGVVMAGLPLAMGLVARRR